jgi:predicted RNA polymerase sigma factor
MTESDPIDDVIQDGIDSFEVERHFGDIAPVYSPAYSNAPLNAVHAKARGAADCMWQKVKEDLEQLDQLEADSPR